MFGRGDRTPRRGRRSLWDWLMTAAVIVLVAWLMVQDGIVDLRHLLAPVLNLPGGGGY